ncbi:hypothetical protein VTK56DRAFT_6313 [Thermocarpiscus australiensis]
MLLAQAPSLTVEFLTWSKAAAELGTGELQRKVLEKNGRVIIIPASTVSEVPELSLEAFYDSLRPVQDSEKIGDISALDEIAREQACLGHKSPDQDNDAPVLLKRSYSAASGHVRFKMAKDPDDRLRCYRKHPNELKERSVIEREYIWFHQEYVDSLRTLGEFRVFIACDEAPGKARVVSVAHTKPGGDAIAVHPLSPRIFGEEVDGTARVEDLKNFALFIHQQLLNR